MPNYNYNVKTDLKRRRVITTTTFATGSTGTVSDVKVITTDFNLKVVTKSSVRTPGWHKLISTRSNLPDNPYDYYAIDLRGGTGRVSKVVGFPTGIQTRQATYDPCSVSGIYDPGWTLDDSSLNGRMIDEAKGQQWNAPIFLAEAGKTASMVVARATHLAQMVNALRRGRFDEFVKQFHKSVSPSNRPGGQAAKKFAKQYGRDARGAAANTWLEYTYGWVPFMTDVRDAVNTLMDVVDYPACRVGRVRASKSMSSITTSAISRIYQDTEEGLIVNGQYVREVRESLRTTWRFTTNPSDLPARFGLLNPLEVIWELVPFSFVADWFLPIGDYLSALDTPFRFNHLGGTIGRRLQTKMTTLQTSINAPYSGGGFSGSGTMVRVSRTKMTTPPAISFQSLKLDTKLSPKRVASAISLLNQQVSRLGR